MPSLSSLKQIFFGCVINSTSVNESGVSVQLATESGALSIFIKVDEPDQSRNSFKAICGMDKKSPCCDYLALYAQSNYPNLIICYVELKGKDIPHAADQITATFLPSSSR
jgi:hypothetical protein